MNKKEPLIEKGRDYLLAKWAKENIMKSLKKYWWIGFLLLLLFSWFYWFQYRPANIRSKCYEWAGDKARELYKKKVDLPPGEPREIERTFVEEGMYLKPDFDKYYEDCLHKEGLK